MEINVLDIRPAGYAHLMEKFKLIGMPIWHTSSVLSTGNHHSQVQDGSIDEIYPLKYWPGDKIGDHLEFALKL